MKTKNILSLILSILIAQVAGIIGSIFTVSSVDTWYSTIVKPSWNPPSWIFGPVWTILYLFMGIAAFLIWQKRKEPGSKTALYIYGIQLVFNSLWSFLFFGMRNPQIAFYEIIVLLTLIIVTTLLFWKVDRWASALMLPYISWVSFATYLNYIIWQLN